MSIQPPGSLAKSVIPGREGPKGPNRQATQFKAATFLLRLGLTGKSPREPHVACCAPFCAGPFKESLHNKPVLFIYILAMRKVKGPLGRGAGRAWHPLLWLPRPLTTLLLVRSVLTFGLEVTEQLEVEASLALVTCKLPPGARAGGLQHGGSRELG